MLSFLMVLIVHFYLESFGISGITLRIIASILQQNKTHFFERKTPDIKAPWGVLEVIPSHLLYSSASSWTSQTPHEAF